MSIQRLRLLISGSSRNTNTVGFFIASNLSNSIDFEILTFHDRFAVLLETVINKIIYRLLPWWIVSRMDRLFVSQVSNFKPDVVVIFKGMEISKRSLIKVRKRGVKLVNYNMDHPFIHFSKGTGNRFVEEAIPYYDLHISYSSIIASQLSDCYHVKTAVLPFGFHLTNAQYDKIIGEQLAEINEVCFVGNPDSIRSELLKELTQSKIKVNVFGFGWEKSFKNSELIQIHLPRKAGSYWSDALEFWRVLRQYRVQLNFFRPHNEGSHNLRTFEVTAVGGVLLTPDSGEQRQFFEEEKEIFFYKDKTSLVDQCRKLLTMTPVNITFVRNQARTRSIKEDYSYKRRALDLVTLIKQLP
ncbi:hypothetical protein WSM22_43570 [Cytophagales bacterium WSM2-2]|nr:hypothetical protein WSM22_43570 [Cytophagales bacterium WSM2-2]